MELVVQMTLQCGMHTFTPSQPSQRLHVVDHVGVLSPACQEVIFQVLDSQVCRVGGIAPSWPNRLHTPQLSFERG